MNIKEFRDKLNAAYNPHGIRFVSDTAEFSKTLSNGFDVWRVRGYAIYPEFLKNGKWYRARYVEPFGNEYTQRDVDKYKFLIDLENSFVSEDKDYKNVKEMCEKYIHPTSETKHIYLFDIVLNEWIGREAPYKI